MGGGGVGYQITSTDYFSLILTPLSIRWTIPINKQLLQKVAVLNLNIFIRKFTWAVLWNPFEAFRIEERIEISHC